MEAGPDGQPAAQEAQVEPSVVQVEVATEAKSKDPRGVRKLEDLCSCCCLMIVALLSFICAMLAVADMGAVEKAAETVADYYADDGDDYTGNFETFLATGYAFVESLDALVDIRFDAMIAAAAPITGVTLRFALLEYGSGLCGFALLGVGVSFGVLGRLEHPTHGVIAFNRYKFLVLGVFSGVHGGNDLAQILQLAWSTPARRRGVACLGAAGCLAAAALGSNYATGFARWDKLGDATWAGGDAGGLAATLAIAAAFVGGAWSTACAQEDVAWRIDTGIKFALMIFGYWAWFQALGEIADNRPNMGGNLWENSWAQNNWDGMLVDWVVFAYLAMSATNDVVGNVMDKVLAAPASGGRACGAVLLIVFCAGVLGIQCLVSGMFMHLGSGCLYHPAELEAAELAARTPEPSMCYRFLDFGFFGFVLLRHVYETARKTGALLALPLAGTKGLGVWAVVIALTAWNFYTAGIDGGVNYAFFGFGTHCGGTADVHNAPCASAEACFIDTYPAACTYTDPPGEWIGMPVNWTTRVIALFVAGLGAVAGYFRVCEERAEAEAEGAEGEAEAEGKAEEAGSTT